MRAVSRAVLLVTLVVLAACTDSPDSAHEVLAALREAVADRDGARMLALQDAESRGSHMQRVRTLRARVERGDDLTAMLADLEITADDVRAASDEELAAQFMATNSIMVRDADFLVAARLVEETTEGPDVAVFTLQGSGERRMRLWFLRENGAWVLDAYRGTH